MESTSSEDLFCGQGYHVVFSLTDYTNSFQSFYEWLKADQLQHFLIALHVHGFRPHVHMVLWTTQRSVYPTVKGKFPTSHIERIVTDVTLKQKIGEAPIGSGYGRVCDYVLRDPYTMFYEGGSRRQAIDCQFAQDMFYAKKLEEREQQRRDRERDQESYNLQLTEDLY